jgi:hypothetical protein
MLLPQAEQMVVGAAENGGHVSAAGTAAARDMAGLAVAADAAQVPTGASEALQQLGRSALALNGIVSQQVEHVEPVLQAATSTAAPEVGCVLQYVAALILYYLL